MTQTKTKPRRMAREADRNAASPGAKAPKQPSKLDQVETMLLAPSGTTIAEIIATTGWQQHSVRGAMAGALKKRGLIIMSEKIDGLRRYRASKPA
jgi:hypothetical protein